MKRVVSSTKQKAARLIANYPQDVIDYVNEFRADVAGLEVYEFQGDALNRVSPAEEIKAMRKEYVYPAMHEGVFKTSSEFDDLVAALDLLDPI